jgi:murein L,D-transpeptidase YcbB/YkuD
MSATRLATLGAILSLGLAAAAPAQEPDRLAGGNGEGAPFSHNLGIEPPEVPDAVVIAPEPDQARTGAIAPPAAEQPLAQADVDLHLPLPDAPPAVVITAEEPDTPMRREDSAALVVVPPPPPPEPVLVVIPPPPAPAEPPAPVRPAAGPIPAETMRAAIEHLRAGRRLTDAEAAGAFAFYEARGFAPLWVESGDWNARARSIRARMAAAADEGLDPGRYRSVAAFHAAGEPHYPALAAAEAQLTEAALLYAREASTGRIRPSQIHELITPSLKPPAAAEVLASLGSADDAGEALRAFNPPHPEFAALRRALAEARAARPVARASDEIPEGPPLRIGMSDPRVPLIRTRLGLDPMGPPLYDRAVSIKVASLQREAGLPVNGMFTPATRRAMLGEGPSPEEAEIIANMELWRFAPRDLGREHIFVNAPALEVVLRRDGEVVHRARTIIGKAQTQTPFFSDEMDHIVVNPSWYVPPGILKREPKYLDPEYAARNGYQIFTRGNHTSVRMPPGSSNALGYVKFMFPNAHAVYLHDTPNRRLFGATNRTLSNGCVRVENPFQLAAMLFASEGWTEERFRRLIGAGERRMNLPKKMPIHLVYFTLTPDSEGRLQRHPDVYGHAARVRQLLGLS